MNHDLQKMWGFLAVGMFTLISMIILNVAGQLAQMPQAPFVIATAFVVAFSSMMFVFAFVSAVDYITHRKTT